MIFPFSRAPILMPAPRAQVFFRMKSSFLVTSSRRTMTQMLTFSLAPKKPGSVPNGTPHHSFIVVLDIFSATHLALFVSCFRFGYWIWVLSLLVIRAKCWEPIWGWRRWWPFQLCQVPAFGTNLLFSVLGYVGRLLRMEIDVQLYH